MPQPEVRSLNFSCPSTRTLIVMPARSRTKSTSKDHLNPKKPRSKEKSAKTADTVSDIEKENRSRTARSRSKAQAKPTNDPRHAKNDTYCLCNQPDDGSPMVCCSECHEWCVPSPATVQSPHGAIPLKIQVSFPVCEAQCRAGGRSWYVLPYRLHSFSLITTLSM